MDITQRNMHELQNRVSLSPPPMPPPPAPTQDLMHPPIAALVSQRREAMVRTNPQLRHVNTDVQISLHIVVVSQHNDNLDKLSLCLGPFFHTPWH